MSEPRYTASTITDEALDQMYRRIETLEHVAAGNKGHVQLIVPELERAEERATIYRAAWHSARRRARVTSDELTRRAPLTGQYAAALARVRALAERWQGAMRDGERHPAAVAVLAALDDPPACTCTYGERCPNCRD
ncbi:hypothetical protein [Streptomyces hirsutus]|uniref:hypothetical protein n=1 Tax=Streptomyces hirsutus TaxID=35620 RepID=UPI00369B3B46